MIIVKFQCANISDTYDIGSKDDEYFIEFCDVEAEDAAEYKCTATNTEGTISTSCMLSVITGMPRSSQRMCVNVIARSEVP